MIENLLQNNGIETSIAGLIVTFAGLVLVALMIYLFNFIFSTLNRSMKHATDDEISPIKDSSEKIDEEELVAIATAIDIYRRLHFDVMPSEMIFERGDPQTPWKMVYKYVSRFQRMR